jgi:inhibitor of cysteine peptidase
MNKPTLITTLAATLAVFSSACSTVDTQSSGNFTEADSGKTFTTAPGGTLDIRLKGNATTGYSWNVAACDKAVIQLANSQYVPNQPHLAGSGGVQHYTFKIVGKGRTMLKVTYQRVWEKDVPPAQTFELQVVSQ